ncbi:MAG: hypothetical protein ABFD64_06285 [Armatimonadota bacterium]
MDDSRRTGQMSDDLLTPSLNEKPKAQGAKPWEIKSYGPFAVFCGVLASTVILYINGKRLGMKKEDLQRIVKLGLVGVVVVILIGCFIPLDIDSRFERSGLNGLNPLLLATQIVSAIYSIIAIGIQNPSYRIYIYKSNGKPEFETDRGPLALIAIAFALVQGLLLYLIIECLRLHNFEAIESITRIFRHKNL